jgi:hypothetical protein
MINPFLNNESPKFDEFIEKSITTTPNHSSFLDSSTQAFLEDETEEPSFVMNEVEQRLNNPVKFTAEKNPVRVPTPVERRLILQQKCSQFFLNRTPSPLSSQISQPLLLNTPSTDSDAVVRTPSMAEQFAILQGGGSSTPRVAGYTPIKRDNKSECTPRQAYAIRSSLEKDHRKSSTTKGSRQIVGNSPVLVSPILNCSPGLGSPILECVPVKSKCSATLKEVHSKENTSRVRQRLQWNHSPETKKQRVRRKFGNQKQILKKTKVVSH